MKKNISILFFVLCILQTAFSQVPNLSGTWNGSITSDSGRFKFTLILTLIDSCGPTYRTTQIEEGRDGVCKYNFIQSKNILLRDVVSFWEDTDNDTYPAHLRLIYNKNTLSGKRVLSSGDDENIILTKKQPISYLEPCLIIKRPCKEMKPVYIPGGVFFVDTTSVVTASVIDNSSNDSDLVTLFIAKNKILDEVQIYSNAEYTIPVLSNENTTITWCACNQGTLGKNTGTLILREYNKSSLLKERSIDINLNIDEQTTIFIIKKTNNQ